VLVAFDEDRAEAGLEEVAAASVSAVECLCVAAVELSHRDREVGARRLQQQVVVVVHQAVGVADQAVPLDDVRNELEEAAAVGVVADDRLSIVAARDHVVEASGEGDAERPADSSRLGALGEPFVSRVILVRLRSVKFHDLRILDPLACVNARPDPGSPRRFSAR
jgi:hypothetical protein